jgi:Tol biopolymer transport system component
MKCLTVLCSSPQISPDGNLLAYEQVALDESGQSSDIQVWILSMEDGSQTLVGHADHSNKNPEWSEEGRLATYNATRQVITFYEPNLLELFSFSNETGEPGSWYPDGSAYLAAEIMDLNPTLEQQVASSHLLRYEMPSENIHDLTLANDLEDAYPVYSPDGSNIAFARKYLDTQRWTPGRQLWIMEEDGSEARPLSDEPNYNHYDFAWSPDGKQIAYLRFDQASLNKPPELWLLDVDSGEALQLVIGGYNPRWIP